MQVKPNTTGKHFNGAGGSVIQKFGTCTAMIRTAKGGRFGMPWQVADVSRALSSVSETCGPFEGPGRRDVLFNNKKCYVVPPGIVEEIMKKCTPVFEYDREG